MQRTVGVPQAIINVEVVTLSIVHLMVIAAEVLAVLGNIRHTTERPVKSCVEDRAFLLGASGHPDCAKCLIPDCSRSSLYLIEAPVGNLALKIAPRLLCADIRDSDAYFYPLARFRSIISYKAKIVTGTPCFL